MANANLFSLTLYCAEVKQLNVQINAQAEILETKVKQMLQSAITNHHSNGQMDKKGSQCVLPGSLCSIL